MTYMHSVSTLHRNSKPLTRWQAMQSVGYNPATAFGSPGMTDGAIASQISDISHSEDHKGAVGKKGAYSVIPQNINLI